MVLPSNKSLKSDQDLRLANLRRGLQDHLYLTMAQDLGLSSLVDSVIQEIVPALFSDVNINSEISWPEDGNSFDKVRYQLAKEIDKAFPRIPIEKRK